MFYFCSDRCWNKRNCHIRATVQNPVATPVPPPRPYHPGSRSQQQRREDLPPQSSRTYDQRRGEVRTPKVPQQERGGRNIKGVPEKKQSWVDSKAFGIAVWILLPLAILIVILGLVLGLKG